MKRLQAEGAPTEPLDFLVPYSCRDIVTSFIGAAKGCETWDEALADLGEGWYDERGKSRLQDPRVLRQCKHFFERERQRLRRAERENRK